MAKQFHFVFVSSKSTDLEKDLLAVHDILAGNQDYIDSNIVYNTDDFPTIYVLPEHLTQKSDSIERLQTVMRTIIESMS